VGSRKILNKQKWVLTPEAFERLLVWLNHDREKAGEKYEVIRSGLIKGFRKHSCQEPEELADETINRVAMRLAEIAATYEGDPARYFYGVAHNVHMEYLRRPVGVPLPQTELPAKDASPSQIALHDDVERLDECLRRCMEQLSARNREMILSYYSGERQLKINLRKELAARLGIKLANLRLQAQRVRAALKKCMVNCLKDKVAASS
jgi:RNA polymerase sigma factor (sigma-70 family)